MAVEHEEEGEGFSFRMDSPERISAVDCLTNADPSARAAPTDEDDDFEFSFVRIPDATSPIAAADDIFSDGKIRPLYPLFDRHLLEEAEKAAAESKKPMRVPLRRLFMEEEKGQSSSFSSTSSSSSSSSMDELDGIPPGTYCVWTPGGGGGKSPGGGKDRCKKSGSSRWSFRDLVIGRSHSDGKAKFLFIPISIQKESKNDDEEENSSKKGKKSLGEKLQLQASNGQGSGRRSYLPYKQDLIGLLTNANGLSPAGVGSNRSKVFGSDPI